MEGSWDVSRAIKIIPRAMEEINNKGEAVWVELQEIRGQVNNAYM